MKIKDRIKELRRVKASELMPNPKNWRTHPEAQKNALKGILAEVGYVDALLARELEDGSLLLIDGHLRAETTPDEEVPVLVIDVNAEEADKILATFDPLAAMAEADQKLLDELLKQVSTDSEALEAMLSDLAKSSEIPPVDESDAGEIGDIRDRFDILVQCDSEEHQRELLEMFDREGLNCRALIV